MKLLHKTLAYIVLAIGPCGCYGAAHSTPMTPRTVIIKHDESALKKKGTYVLGCDAGRYEVRVGIFELVKNRLTLAVEYKTPAEEITAFSPDRMLSFALYIKAVLNDITNRYPICIGQACIGTAGPTAANRDIIDDQHAPFGVSSAEIKKHTSLKNVLVINDFETLALGVEAIDPSEITTLLPGAPRNQSTKLIIGAGGGLGSSLLLWNTTLESYMPSPLNYSFTEFNPQTQEELKYNDFLKRTSNNAWGKVLGASAGIVDIYTFLHNPETPIFQHAHYQEIFAKRETDPACKAAVDMYMRLYTRLMRNAVYTQAPYAGLYITNDVAVKNPSLFTDPAFKAAFLNTGDLTNAGNAYLHNYLQQIPVYLVTSPDLKLFGAALYGMSFLNGHK